MKKTIDELDTELCNYCPLEEWKKGATAMYFCEGSKCGEAYKNYLDEYEEDEEK